MTPVLGAPELPLELETWQKDTCRFCGCSENSACSIPVAVTGNVFRLARPDEEVAFAKPCWWYLPRVCSNPLCIEKLIAEWREKAEEAA